MICPGAQGGKNWPAGAYNPRTNVMFMPMQNMCGNYTTTTDKRDPSKVYGLDFPTIIAPGATKVGTVWAISAETGRTMWKYEQRAGVLSLVATAGGLVFGGDANGRFRALDERTGKVLWETNLGRRSAATRSRSPWTGSSTSRWRRDPRRGHVDAARHAGAQTESPRPGRRLRAAVDAFRLHP